jgi:hypothetical protein
MREKNARFARTAAMGRLYDLRVKLSRSIFSFLHKDIDLYPLSQLSAVIEM